MDKTKHLALLIGIKQVERERMRKILIRVNPHMTPEIITANDKQLLQWMYEVKGFKHQRFWSYNHRVKRKIKSTNQIPSIKDKGTNVCTVK